MAEADTGNGFTVDSFFDISYQFEFQGAPGSSIDGVGGITTSTARLAIRNDDCYTGDTPLAGVSFTLTGVDAQGSNITQTATTDAAGEFHFTDLIVSILPHAGTGYTVTETVPPGNLPTTPASRASIPSPLSRSAPGTPALPRGEGPMARTFAASVE